jgi:F0F1-type ATP synthase membrane subunit b/b'
LTESRKNLAQAEMLVESILKEAEETAAKSRFAMMEASAVELNLLTVNSKLQITTMESRVRKQILDYVVAQALQRTTRQLEGKLSHAVQLSILERNISDYWLQLDPESNRLTQS